MHAAVKYVGSGVLQRAQTARASLAARFPEQASASAPTVLAKSKWPSGSRAVGVQILLRQRVEISAGQNVRSPCANISVTYVRRMCLSAIETALLDFCQQGPGSRVYLKPAPTWHCQANVAWPWRQTCTTSLVVGRLSMISTAAIAIFSKLHLQA